MIHYPSGLGPLAPTMLSPWSIHGGLRASIEAVISPAAGSVNWIAANVGVFIPVTIPSPVTVTKLWWGNGAAVAGNIDVGIFDEAGNRIVSAGSTAAAGTSTLQYVDITDTVLQRGRYYLGMTSDTSGATQKVYAIVPAAGICQALGLLEDTSCAPPLATNANPATFVAYSRAFIPACGLKLATAAT